MDLTVSKFKQVLRSRKGLDYNTVYISQVPIFTLGWREAFGHTVWCNINLLSYYLKGQMENFPPPLPHPQTINKPHMHFPPLKIYWMEIHEHGQASGIELFNDPVTGVKLHLLKIYHNILPGYLSGSFKMTSEVHHYNTRDSQFNFVIPRVRGQYGSNTFQFTAVREWNSLPGCIKSINSLSSFKKEVKTHLAMQARLREGSIP